MSKLALVPTGIIDASDDVMLYDELPSSFANIGFFVPRYMGPLADLDATEQMPDLEVVQLLTAGYDHAVPRVRPGVTLCNAGELHVTSTAELAIALTLARLRRLDDFARVQREGTWLAGRYDSIADKRVLVLGHGPIGQRICALLAAFEATPIPVARHSRKGVHGVDELDELLPMADVVILIVPLNEGTRGLVDAEFLSRMQPGALLVNVARGPVVVTDDLVAALNSGRIHAAIDVTDPEPLPSEHPLWQAPNLLISPHVGGNTSAFTPRARHVLLDQMDRWRAGRALLNVVRR